MRYLVPWLLAVGCQGFSDADGDGLSTRTEHDLGTNPNDRDTDHDGLGDFVEVNVYGTDPLLRDTDGDGADDGEEVELCLDPLDAASHPYSLGWPMVPCTRKNALASAPSPAVARVGARIRRDYVYDLNLEAVDLYDFSGKPTIVSVYSEFRTISITDYPNWSDPTDDREVAFFPAKWVLQLALDGDINIVVILGNARDDFDAVVPVTLEDMVEFCEFDNIPCLGDLSLDVYYHVDQPSRGTSAWLLLDEQMIVREFLPEPYYPDDPVHAFDEFHEKLSIMLDIVPP